MYEEMTFEVILKRMLDRLPLGLDKREGSIIYDAIAPCAVELQLMYIELDNILKETFGDTASREYLLRRASERGIIPYPASFAVLKGEFNKEIDIGTRFSLDELNYKAIEKISDFTYKMQCESVGVVGNGNFGDLIPINYIQGLTSAKLTELLIPAQDKEDTESIRTRYFSSFDTKAYGGNVQDYLDKTNGISGVLATKVTPVWNGGGTVKLTILDSTYNKASDVLIDTVQQIIDPTKDGMGIGVAPIGHIVTVDTVEEILVNVSATMTFDIGYSFELSESKIINTINEYLLEIRKNWQYQSLSVIRIAQIEARILSVEGIIDITNTRINGMANNLTLTKYEIPIFEGVTND